MDTAAPSRRDTLTPAMTPVIRSRRREHSDGLGRHTIHRHDPSPEDHDMMTFRSAARPTSAPETPLGRAS